MGAREPAVIKGGRDGLYLMIDHEADMASVVGVLRDRLRASPQFFRGAALRIQSLGRTLSHADREMLAATVEEFGMVLSEHSDEKLAPSAAASGAGARERLSEAPTSKRPPATEQESEGPVDAEPTLLVKRTLRSGQTITYDGNVVIRGDVNPGAVVMSTGDIIVLGALRGVAHAGAEGDTSAIVMAFRLEPTQLRIAGLISRAPDEKSDHPIGPEVARVRGDMIQVEAYKP